MDFHVDANAESRSNRALQPVADIIATLRRVVSPLDGDDELLENLVFAVDVDLPGLVHRRRQRRDAIFDLRRKKHRTTHLEHIVGAPDDPPDQRKRAPAATAAVGIFGELYEVAGPPT